MNKLKLFCTVAIVALAPEIASAGISRAWVSGKGVDVAGCGITTNPCRTFQYVISNVINPGGIINILDPARYDQITNIPFALSIINDGVGVAAIQANSGAAITINASSTDAVILRGLQIEGLNSALTGIQWNSGGGLAVTESTIIGFTKTGINFTPGESTGSRNLNITNTKIGINGISNINLGPAAEPASIRVLGIQTYRPLPAESSQFHRVRGLFILH